MKNVVFLYYCLSLIFCASHALWAENQVAGISMHTPGSDASYHEESSQGACDAALKSSRSHFRSSHDSVTSGLTEKKGEEEEVLNVMKDLIFLVAAVASGMEEEESNNQLPRTQEAEDYPNIVSGGIPQVHYHEENRLIDRLHQKQGAMSVLLNQQKEEACAKLAVLSSSLQAIEKEEAKIRNQVMVLSRPDIMARANNVKQFRSRVILFYPKKFQKVQQTINQLGQLIENEFIASMALVELTESVPGIEAPLGNAIKKRVSLYSNRVIHNLNEFYKVREKLDHVHENLTQTLVQEEVHDAYIFALLQGVVESLTEKINKLHQNYHQNIQEKDFLILKAPFNDEDEDYKNGPFGNEIAEAFSRSTQVYALTCKNLDLLRDIQRFATMDSKVSAEETSKSAKQIIDAYKNIVIFAKNKVVTAVDFFSRIRSNQGMALEDFHQEILAFSQHCQKHFQVAIFDQGQFADLADQARHLTDVLREFSTSATAADVDRASSDFKKALEKSALEFSSIFKTQHQQPENTKKRKFVV